MIWARSVAELRAAVGSRHPEDVGFVPTMGALHRGHTTLFDVARAECRVVVASVFVNPTQFNDPADLASYPRDEASDGSMAEAAGVDVLFVPSIEEVYPEGHATRVVMAGPALGLEGDHRAGHFDGVATVCLKLFTMVAPGRVYFGQKDAQQVAVIRQMVKDLSLPLALRVVPTVRDADGLALSSRNIHLSPAERRRALAVPRALELGLAAFRAGLDPVDAARSALAGIGRIDYVAVAAFHGVATLVLAVRVGRTRLIDNVPLGDPQAAGLGG